MVKSKSKKINSVEKRILAALVMLPVAIGALWFGYPYIDILALLVGTLFAWEWANMVPNRNVPVYALCYLFSLCVSLLYSTGCTAVVIAATTIFVWLKARREKERFLLALGVPYISIGIGALLWIYHFGFGRYFPSYNFYMTLWFFVMVWSMDIGGYVVGCSLKGPKLAPKISPNKTWSGLIGGIVLAMAVSLIYFEAFMIFGVLEIDLKTCKFFSLLGGLVALISQIGDLIESAIKRHLGIKDASTLIPGHGGIFDRIDGLVFAAPFVYWLFAYWLFASDIWYF